MEKVITVDDFILQVKSLVGVPYHMGGCGINGVDCGGLLFLAADRAGVIGDNIKYHINDYKRFPADKSLTIGSTKAFKKLCVPLDSRPPRKGDMGMMSIGHYGIHIYILIGDDKFIHADSKAGKVVECYMNEKMLNLTRSFWTPKFYL